MACLNRKWTRNFLSLSVLLVATPQLHQCKHTEIVIGYCDEYLRLVETEDEARAAQRLPLKMKQRLLTNEKNFLTCPVKGKV